MKNKDIDLTELKLTVSYLTDGCGRKVEKMRYMTISRGEDILVRELVTKDPFKWIMEWLEKDIK